MKLFFRFLSVVFLFSITVMGITFSQEVTFYSPQYFSVSENNFDPIRHLDYEPVIFEICTEEGEIKDMKSELICQNSNTIEEITLSKFGNSNCYYGYVQETICRNSDLEISYSMNNDNRLYSRTLKETKESNVVDFVLSNDYEDIDDPVELSYYLIVHNKIKGFNDDSQLIYQKLRDMRDNEEKCWPNNDCDILDTSVILYNLKIAGYKENRRLIEDGRIYLDSDNTLLNGTIGRAEFDVNLSFNTNPTPAIDCEIFVDGESEDNITLNDDDIYEIRENVEVSFNISCDDVIDNINISVVDDFGEDFSTELSSEREYNFMRNELFCYGDSNSCELTPTLYSLLTYEKDLSYYNELIKFIDIYKEEISSNQQYIEDRDDTLKSSLYFSLMEDENVANHIKFRQNNDGSWGGESRNDRRIYETYTSVRSLLESDNAKEYIEDGEEWMYFNEPVNGWGNVERNSQAYLTIERFIRPFLVFEDYHQVINSSKTFTLKNPSIFEIQDVKIEVDEDLEKYISYTKDLQDILPDESVEFDVTAEGIIPVDQKIMMKVTGVANGEREEFIEVPIIISSNESIIILTNSVEFSQANTNLIVEVENKIPDSKVSCDYTNSLNSQSGVLNLNNENSNKISTLSIENENLKIGNLKLNLECEYDGNIISLSKNITINEKTPTFEVLDNFSDRVLIEDFNDFEISILSTFNENQDISVSFIGPFQGVVSLENELSTLRPRDRRILSFTHVEDEELLDTLTNSTGTIEIVSSLGYSKNINFEFRNNPQSPSFLVYIIAGVVFLVIVIGGLIIYRFIEMKKDNDSAPNSSTNNAMMEDDEMLDLDDLDFN